MAEPAPTTDYIAFVGAKGEDTILVRRRCPGCGSFIAKGRVLVTPLGAVRLEDWKCTRCGPITPEWTYDV